MKNIIMFYTGVCYWHCHRHLYIDV